MILGKMQIPQVATIQPSVDLLDGLISVWELDESIGTVAYDSHGSNNGTISGATINETGKLGKAYSFDGSNLGDKVNIGDVFAITDDMTIACWVNMASLVKTKNNRHCFFGKGIEWYNNYNNSVEYFLSFYSEAGKFRFTVGNSYRIDACYSRANLWSAGTWYHVIGTYKKSTDVLSLYVDTVLEEGKSHIAENGYGIPNLSHPITIGASTIINNEGKYYMDGLIDQCAIWSKCLNSDERSALYNSGNGLAYQNW